MKRATVIWALACLLGLVSGCGYLQGSDGSPGRDGINGSNGRDGQNGHDGQNGSPGLNGHDGQNGRDATGVTTVLFCPGYQPTSYPEYGICIAGNLYAVYWDKQNAFMAEIVPGNYVSTSTSAPCNFQVAAGCTVNPL